MIREVKRDDVPVCVEIIRKSFKTVADEFGLMDELYSKARIQSYLELYEE